MSRRPLVAAAVALAVGALHSVAACSYLDQHPPQVCITADGAPDGGVTYVTIAPEAGVKSNPGL